MSVAFMAMVLAALVRSVGVTWLPSYWMELITLSGGLWVRAFALYLAQFSKMLVQPRVDGHPG